MDPSAGRGINAVLSRPPYDKTRRRGTRQIAPKEGGRLFNGDGSAGESPRPAEFPSRDSAVPGFGIAGRRHAGAH